MADQIPHIHDHQQFIDAISTAEQLLMFDENHNPLLDDFVNDMLQDPGDNVAGNYETHFSGTLLEGNSSENVNFNNGFSHNRAFGNPIQIPIWPVPPSPHSCTCCQTLREFFHVNGTQVLKLDVHGRLGLISHAILEKYNSNHLSSENHEYHMFDFCQESIGSVKQFLIQYCNDRKREGYVMLQDPLANFYNALCIGIDPDDSFSQADIFPPQTSRGLEPKNPGAMHMYQEDDLNQPVEERNKVNKSYFASQSRGKERER